MSKIEGFIKESNAAYCGLLIIDNTELLKLITMLDNDWERLAHHMTIKMGNLPENLKDKKGNIFVDLSATHIGYLDNKVAAVKVATLIKTENEFPHITLAVNRNNGGKPFLSNKITDWKKLDRPISLKGKLTEFDKNSKEI